MAPIIAAFTYEEHRPPRRPEFSPTHVMIESISALWPDPVSQPLQIGSSFAADKRAAGNYNAWLRDRRAFLHSRSCMDSSARKLRLRSPLDAHSRWLIDDCVVAIDRKGGAEKLNPVGSQKQEPTLMKWNSIQFSVIYSIVKCIYIRMHLLKYI